MKEDYGTRFDPMQNCRHQFIGGSLISADAKLPGHRECIVCGLTFSPTGVPLAYNVRKQPVSRDVSCDHTPGGTFVQTGIEDQFTIYECVQCGFELKLRTNHAN